MAEDILLFFWSLLMEMIFCNLQVQKNIVSPIFLKVLILSFWYLPLSLLSSLLFPNN